MNNNSNNSTGKHIKQMIRKRKGNHPTNTAKLTLHFIAFPCNHYEIETVIIFLHPKQKNTNECEALCTKQQFFSARTICWRT